MSLFENMNKEILMEFDRFIDLCAELSMKAYLGKPINTQGIPEELAYNESWLLNSYREPFVDFYNRRFPEKGKETIRDDVWPIIYSEFLDTVSYLKANRRGRPEFGVVFPIMFYTFVCNNVLNQNSVTRNATRKKKEPEATERADVGARLNSTYHSRALCAFNRKIVGPRSDRLETYKRHSQELFAIVEKKQRENNKGTDTENLSIRLPISLAEDLRDNPNAVYRYQTSAELGLFLRDLLLLSQTENEPLKTLIRLVIANKMDQLIIRTGVLHKLKGHVFFDITAPNSLLKWYYEYQHPDQAGDYVKSCVSKLEEFVNEVKAASEKADNSQQEMMKHVCKDNPPQKNDNLFGEAYSSLAKLLPITDTDMEQILDFYLNKKSLTTALSLWETSNDLFVTLAQFIKGTKTQDYIPQEEQKSMLTKVVRGAAYEDIINTVYDSFDDSETKRKTITVVFK